MALTGDPLRTGISGLLMSQRNISVVSHNVTNVNLDGYSRQRTDMLTNNPSYSSAGYIGNGGYVSNTYRAYDTFLQRQLVENTSSSDYYSTFHNYALQMDNMLADPNSGLSPALESFFKANQGVANDPTSVPAREVLLTNAESMVQRFGVIYDRMDALRESVNLEISNIIPEVNSIAREIGALNESIAGSPGRARGVLPNDLLDRRDQLIVEISKYVEVQTLEQPNGSLNVYVGNGQAIVNDFESYDLTLEVNQYDTSVLEIGYQTSNTSSTNVSSLIKGGRLGALLDLRSDIIDPIQNSLGRIAYAVTDSYNAQHKLGMDLNSSLGLDFFSVGPSEVFPDLNNTGAATFTATITDTNLLTESDYRLSFDGANYSLTRLSDNTVDGPIAPGALPYITAEGFEIDNIAGAPAAGDSFLIRPTRAGARTMGLVIDNTSEIAAATPVRAELNLNNIGSGTATMTGVFDTTGAEFTTTAQTLTPEIAIVFDPLVPNQYDILQVNPPGPNLVTGAVYNQTTGLDVVADNALGFGYEVHIAGKPGLGDRFDISYNLQGVKDNGNMLELSGLQSTKSMLGTSATYNDAYSSIITKVGTRTHQADIANRAQETLLRQSQNARESVSGVNLDEEAANMLRFQQAYQAAAQVISSANQMFDTLLAATR
ncbi:MAG: flagellar hook-associated protein FlgK [Gammaproteobacteria bacterium]|nr:flagellar hook-associated protein FlgK [Gammaproteobacteria bacterium]